MALSVENVSCSYGAKSILKEVSIPSISAGELTVLVGPNAVGKTTLFKTIAGLVRADSGQICLAQQDLVALPKFEALQKVCYMPQTFTGSAALSVFEVVLLAKKQCQSWRVSQEDMAAVEQQLHQFAISDLAHRPITELSGGQQQIVSLCQTLIRKADIYLLDEPTSALDLQRQLKVLQHLKDEARHRSAIMIISIHDLNLASRFADQLIVMDQGRVIQTGKTDKVLSSGAIEKIYGVNLEMMRCKHGNIVLSATL